jgi:Immunoglobulin I-set domain
VTNKLIIECNIKSSLDFTKHKIKWYKDDIEIRPSSLPSGGIPTLYEQELNENSGKLKLVITYPMNTDCGLYRCCITDRNLQKLDEISHLVYKIFNPPPHVPLEYLELGEKKNRVMFENVLSDITVEEGSRSVRLNCKISQCNAQSEIKWFRNNEELPVDDRRDKYRFTKSYNRLCLEILNVGAHDAGSYECRVQNQYSEISTKCNVHVFEKVERIRSRTTPRGKKFIITR